MATGPLKGMDFDTVETWGNRITNTEVGNVRQLVNSCVTQARQLQWSGSDFEKFVANEVSAVETALKTLENALNDMGQSAVRNATAQRTTSTSV